MLSRLRRTLKPPRFEEDGNKTRTAAVLNAICLTIVAVCMVSLFIPFLPGGFKLRILTVVCILAVNLVALFLLRRGRVSFACIILLGTQWLIVTGGAAVVGAFGTGGYGAYIILILLGGLLLGPSAGFLLAAMSAMASLAVITAEQYGFIPLATPHSTAMGVWATQASLFIIVAVHTGCGDLADTILRG